MNAGASERTLHPLKGALVDLRNTAFVHSQDSANFFHCQITIVIERNDLLIPLRKRLHAIMAGTTLGVFSALLKGRLTAAEIARECGLNESATVALLGALTASGYLRYNKGKYGLTPQSRKWLAPKDGWSLYEYMPHLGDVWQMASHLEGFLRDGAALDIHGSSTEGEWERYQRAMRALATICAREMCWRDALFSCRGP